MKTRTQQFVNALLVSLLMTAPLINAKATGTEPGDSTTKASTFEISMFTDANWTVNLMLSVRQPKRVMVTVRGANNTVLYRDYLKKSPGNYRWKFNFEESESGVYQFEISDGQQLIVRQIEVVDKPVVGTSQRYLTYGPPSASK